MAKTYVSADEVGAAPATLENRVADLEDGQRRKVLVLADPPDPGRVNEYIEASSGRHLFFNGVTWVPVVMLVSATNLALPEGSLDGFAPLSDFPLGPSVLAGLGSGLAGWPTSDNYNVLTIRTTTTKGSQIACLGSGTRTYVRRWNNSIPAWGAWGELSAPAP
jgi:hypothetical protein